MPTRTDGRICYLSDQFQRLHLNNSLPEHDYDEVGRQVRISGAHDFGKYCYNDSGGLNLE